MPSVLIVILNYITYELTLEFVDEVKLLNYDNFSIMVIDNASPNESETQLFGQSQKKGFVFYVNKTNSGYASGNNIGLKYGTERGYKYCWILNNDVHLPDKDVLKKMVNEAENDERIACVGTKIFDPDGNVCYPYNRRPNFWDMTLGCFFLKSERKKYADVSGEVYRLHGCSMLCKNEVMNEVGFFDERTFLYGEEQILAERLMKKNYKSYYLASTNIIHMESTTMKLSKVKKKVKAEYSVKSMDIYLREYRNFNPVAVFFCKLVRKTIIMFS